MRKRLQTVIPLIAFLLGITPVFAQSLTASFSTSPASQLCNDSTFTFKSTSSYTGSGTVTYTWDFGDGSVKITGTTVTKTYSAAGSYTVKMVAVSSDALVDTAKKTVTVYPKPKVKWGFTGVTCARNEFVFADSSTVSSGYIASYLWTFPGGTTYTTGYPIHFFANPGTYQVKLKVTTDKGCTDSLTKSIVIRDRPKADFDYISACQGLDLTFDSKIPKGSFQSLKWDFGDNTFSTSANANDTIRKKKYTVPGIYNVKLIAYNTTTGCADSITQQVPVYDNPKPNFFVRDFCTTFNDSVYIVNKVKPLFGDVTEIDIKWNQNNPSFTPYKKSLGNLRDTLRYKYVTSAGGNKLGKYQITVVIYTSHGCSSTYKDSVRILNEPDANFGMSDSFGCENSPITFYDSSQVAATFGGTISKWLWNFGDQNGSTDQNPSHIYKKAGKYKVTLYAYNQGGCMDSASRDLIVGERPEPDFTFENQCKQVGVTFSDATFIDTTRGDSVIAWQWNFGDGSSVSTQQNPTHSFSAVDTYKVVLKTITNRGCSDTISHLIPILPDATPDFSVSGSCERNPVFFSDKSTAPPGKTIIGYSWDFGDGASDNSGSKNVSHIYGTPNTYLVSLRVTTSDGCISDPIKKTITIIPSPLVDFTTSSSCVGRTVQFTNLTSLDPNESVAQYRWYYGDGNSSFQTTKHTTHTYATTGLYNVSLVAITTKGCRDSLMKQIEVSPIPKADFTFKNVCNDSAVSFEDASNVTSGSIASRTWKWGDGNVTSGNDDKPFHKYTNPGAYKVTLVINSAAGCTDSIQKTVTTYPKPKADFRFTTHCADSAIEFYDLSTMPGGSVYAWKWLFGDGKYSFDQNPTHVYGGEFGGVYPVQLTAYSKLGCTDVITKNVDVHLLPKTNSIYLGGDQICSQTDFFYEDSDPDNAGWLWTFGDGTTSTQRSGNHQYPDSGYYNLRLDLVNKWGCRDSFFKVVYAHPLPIVKFGWKGGCKGVDVVFRDSTTIYNKKKRRLLTVNFGDGSFPLVMDSLIFHHNYATPGTYTITYTVAENSDVEPQCARTITKQITIYDNPAVGFKANTVCFGEPTQFFDTTTGSGDIASWKWDFGDGTTDISNNPSPLHFYKTDGVYSVTLTLKTKAGCSGVYTANVTVLKKPKADFKLLPNPITVLKPDVTIVNNSSSDVISYKWSFGDGDESDTKDPGTRRYPDTGHYVIMLTVRNANGCADTLIDTLKVKMAYTIHAPNVLTLNGDDVNDKWKPLGEGVENYEIVIMDRWGQQVFHSTDFNEYWMGDYNGNGVQVPEGVYVYQIKIVDFAQEEVKVVKGTITVIK
jgi:gliding motility-associated-like protein